MGAAMANVPSAVAKQYEQEIAKINSQPAVTPAISQATAEPDDKGEEVKKLEAQYKTLQGKYNSEVPRYAAELKAREDEISKLREEVESARKEREARVETQRLTEEELRARYSLSEQDGSYESDLLNTVAKIARAEARAASTSVSDAVKKEVEPVKQRLEQTAEEMYERELERMVPDWRQLNEDQGFLAWLAVEDRFSGLTRMDLIKRHHQNNDAARVAAFFDGYKATLPGEKTPIESQRVPASQGHAPQVSSKSKTITVSDYRRISDDMVAGRIPRSKWPETQQYLDEMLSAGLVVPG